MQQQTRRNIYTGALLLPVLVLVTLPGKGAGQQCPGQNSCILPQPMPPPFAVGESDLRVALLSLRCTLACVQQVRQLLVHILCVCVGGVYGLVRVEVGE